MIVTASTTLVIKTTVEELQKVETAVDEISGAEGWQPDIEFKIRLVLDELCTNVINYAHRDDLDHDMTVTIESDDDEVRVEIVDDGDPFNPLEDAPEPDTESALADRRIGGLGVYFVKTLVDDARYWRDNDKNHVALSKRRS